MSWSVEIQERKDPRLRTLELALDPEHMRGVFQQRGARYTGGAAITGVEIAIFRRHVNRCVVRYRLARAGADTLGVIGKVQDAGVGLGVLEMMRELWRHGFARDAEDGLTMPEPYEYLDSHALLLQEEVGGTPGRLMIRQSPGPGPMRVAARALAKLHRCGIPAREVRGVREHLRRCHPRHEFLTLALPELKATIESVVDRALAIESRLGDVPITPVHGDFHLGQLHLDGERAWLVDFDAMGWADPASDLGNLLAFLKDKAKRDASIDALIAAFLDEYDARCPGVSARAPLYEAITYLRRACKALRLQDDGWRDKASRMVRSAEAAIERMEQAFPPAHANGHGTNGTAHGRVAEPR